MIKKVTLLFTVLVFYVTLLHAQTESGFSEAIEDNSFLIEEAINQEDGVIQHISNGIMNTGEQKDFTYSFTQEIPVMGQRHQFSYTLNYVWLGSGKANGFGDMMLNYRLQLMDGENWAWFSPRLSFIIPTGDRNKELGDGNFGLQLNLPASKRLAEKVYSHANLGLTYIPKMSFNDTKETFTSYFGGISFIWLAHRRFNMLVESLVNMNNELDDTGKKVYNNEFIVNPGIRFSIPVGNLEIVPGIGIPITFAGGENSTMVFFYLSFEHPFK